jgi:uncharacterized protein YdaU (DUF1376 family)
MHYYKRHIGDYAKKAGHLSALEHGVYNLIIDSYYDREQAPTMAEAMRWARARTADEQAAVVVVLEEFFTLDADRYRQNRIEDELKAYQEKSDKNRTIAFAREEAKRLRDQQEQARIMDDRRGVERYEHETCSVREPELHDTCTTGQPNHKPLTTNQEPQLKAKSKTSAPALPLPEWIPQKSWDGFLAMRKRQKKPVTDEAIPLAIKKLARLRDAGHDPGQVLDQSTLNCWQGLFEVRAEPEPLQPKKKDWQ